MVVVEIARNWFLLLVYVRLQLYGGGLVRALHQHLKPDYMSEKESEPENLLGFVCYCFPSTLFAHNLRCRSIGGGFRWNITNIGCTSSFCYSSGWWYHTFPEQVLYVNIFKSCEYWLKTCNKNVLRNTYLLVYLSSEFNVVDVLDFLPRLFFALGLLSSCSSTTRGV